MSPIAAIAALSYLKILTIWHDKMEIAPVLHMLNFILWEYNSFIFLDTPVFRNSIIDKFHYWEEASFSKLAEGVVFAIV